MTPMVANLVPARSAFGLLPQSHAKLQQQGSEPFVLAGSRCPCLEDLQSLMEQYFD